MRAILFGANGAMGKLISDLLGEEIVGRVSIDGENGAAKHFWDLGKSDADVVIDFSHHTAIADVLSCARQLQAAAVIGTTGHTVEEKAMIQAASEEIPVFYVIFMAYKWGDTSTAEATTAYIRRTATIPSRTPYTQQPRMV